MERIVAMGERDSVMIFRALGLEVCAVSSADQGRAELQRLAKENVGIIYMTEQLASALGAEADRYRDALKPAIILIPGKEGTLGIGSRKVTATIERAVGADIL